MIKKFFISFFNLFYPRVCAGCGGDLVSSEKFICLNCHNDLVPSNYSAVKENRLYNSMVARIPIQEASAFYYFTKEGIVQQLLHELKYKGKKDLGIYLGELYGQHLKQFDRFKTIDMVIPVPLHQNRQKERGYNQSAMIAKGISNVLEIGFSEYALNRKQETQTQTNKSRVERWENVKNAFQVKEPELFKNKHVLLVDDVITTGATLEACARNLLSIENIKISIASLAYTDEL